MRGSYAGNRGDAGLRPGGTAPVSTVDSTKGAEATGARSGDRGREFASTRHCPVQRSRREAKRAPALRRYHLPFLRETREGFSVSSRNPGGASSLHLPRLQAVLWPGKVGAANSETAENADMGLQ